MKFYFLHPFIGKYQERIGFDLRYGYKIEFNTIFFYLKGDEENSSWFEIRILGFGLGVSKGSRFHNDQFF